MANCFQPMQGAIATGNELKFSLDIEIGLSYGLGYVTASGGLSHPLVLSPEAEMRSSALTPGFLQWFTQSSLSKYTSADIEILQSDPDKLARFVEVTPRTSLCYALDAWRDHPFPAVQVYSDCIVPNLRAATEAFLQYKLLLVTNPPSIFEAPFVAMCVACGLDIKSEYAGGVVPTIFSKFAAFTQSWAPLLRRWCGLANWPSSGASY
jgi:hypothetical protein